MEEENSISSSVSSSIPSSLSSDSSFNDDSFISKIDKNNTSNKRINVDSEINSLMSTYQETYKQLNTTSIQYDSQPQLINEHSEINKLNDSDKLRNEYLKKLSSMNLLSKLNLNRRIQKTERKYNSIIIFDWDDTLLCSTYLIKHNLFDNEKIQSISQKKMENIKEKILKLENKVIKILTMAIEFGNTYIITNATKGWVEYSSMKYFPSVFKMLNKIKIISARSSFESKYPNDSYMWKLAAFNFISNSYNKNLVTNIICIGDSFIEMDAAQKMLALFKEVFIKTIKFREEPKIEQMIKELDLVCNKFKSIHSAVRNISIKVEKKDKVKENNTNK